MATTDDKDKKIGEVPHLENVTGDEKIPVSAEGEPAYIKVEQINSIYPMPLDIFEQSEGSVPEDVITDLKNAIDANKQIAIRNVLTDEDTGHIITVITYLSSFAEYAQHGFSQYIHITFPYNQGLLFLDINTHEKTYEAYSENYSQNLLNGKQDKFALGKGLYWESDVDEDGDEIGLSLTLKEWFGTKEQFDALESRDANTKYYILKS